MSKRKNRNKSKVTKTLQNSQGFEEVNVSKDEYKTITNSLSGLVDGLGYGTPYGSSQVNQVDTLFKSNRWYLVSNMRQIISELYVEHGIIQTLVDQPIDDAFRKGLIINSDQLSEEEIEELQYYIDKNEIIETIKQGMKWTRLYGGGGVMINTGGDHAKPLEEVKQGSEIFFIPVDMWELFYNKQNTSNDYNSLSPFYKGDDKQFNYYGVNVNSSRVLSMKGKEAPSFIRPRLRGWGMSVIERMVRSFNQYLKNNDVIFELLDEAKIDVYKIQGFNASLGTPDGTNRIKEQAQLSNQLKSVLNALVMDADDDYQQKQMAFSGLGEMLTQIRQGIASDLKMPITKLFGVSSAGFNSGEDDIENYNAMIETEVRSKSKGTVISVLNVICQSLFGKEATDMTVEFHPLRVLSAEKEEEVKNKKFDRFSSLYAQGFFTPKEYAQVLIKHDIVDIETEVEKGTREMEVPESPASFDEPESSVSTSTSSKENG